MGAAGERFLAISGDVALAYALETMARRRPEVADTVASLLKRLRGS